MTVKRMTELIASTGEPCAPSTDDAGAGTAPAERTEIPERYKWRLDKIFPDWASWEGLFPGGDRTLCRDSPSARAPWPAAARPLLGAIEAMHAAERRLYTGLVFAGMKSDEDTRIGENTARKGRISSLAVNFSEAVSWFESELLAITSERLKELMAEEPGLKLYRHFIDDIQRARRHTLSADQEALLAGAGLMARGAGQVFNAFDNADLAFGDIEDEDGNRVALTKARYYKFLKSRDRRVRQDAFTPCFSTRTAPCATPWRPTWTPTSRTTCSSPEPASTRAPWRRPCTRTPYRRRSSTPWSRPSRTRPTSSIVTPS